MPAEISEPISELDIAIIGMAGRFPGAPDVDSLWKNISEGTESVTFFSDEDLISAGVDPAWVHDPAYVKARCVLPDVELFDASFFGFSPREAEIMDPQHRIFLECASAALEDAGYSGEAEGSRIGVYAGSGINTYLLYNLMASDDVASASDEYQLMLANDKDTLATRVSYKLGLTGPSLAVQSSCSTSLAAVNLACQSLLTRQCDMVLAGGVSLKLPQLRGHWYRQGGVFSPDGHCRAFDEKAAGTIAGSGAGIVVLKRMQDAVQDRDFIYAVIKGTAINNDGSAKASYTAPSVKGQSDVITEALHFGNVSPDTITYVECHGTGTLLGDPIEITALSEAFRAGTDRKRFCAIGSIKTNIGHLDQAAGIASLIKTAMALRYRKLPPSLHFRSPNPQIDFDESPFFVNHSLTDWSSCEPRRAGVSSFGIGGTNVHVVLEESPVPGSPTVPAGSEIIPLSARSAIALQAASRRLAETLRRRPDISLADCSYTLARGRRTFLFRRAVIGATPAEVAAALAEHKPATGADSEAPREILLMLSGRSLFGMGDAMERWPRLRQGIDASLQLLKPDVRTVVRDALLGSPDESQVPAIASALIEHALASLLMDWGVRPAAVIGLGSSEYVAASLAGVISLEDALSLISAGSDSDASRADELAMRAMAVPRSPGAIAWLSGLHTPGSPGPPVQSLLSGSSGEPIVIGPLPWANAASHGYNFGSTEQPVLLDLLSGMARLWERGFPVAWDRFFDGRSCSRIPLPTYPFEQKRYWIEPRRKPSGAQPFDAGTQTTATAHPRPALATEYLAPQSDTERAIADVWRNLLGIERVGVRDDFLELGGDSLLATKLVAELRKTLKIDLPLAEFFDAPTIEKVAAIADRARDPFADSPDLGQLLEEIENLPDDVVRALLDEHEKRGSPRPL